MGNHFDWDDVPRCEVCTGRPCVCLKSEPTAKPSFNELASDYAYLELENTNLRAEVSALRLRAEAAEKDAAEACAKIERLERELSSYKNETWRRYT